MTSAINDYYLSFIYHLLQKMNGTSSAGAGSKGTMRSVTLTEFGTEEGFSFMKNVHPY